MPELLHLMRVQLHRVVGGAGEQTKLAREETENKHDTVCQKNVVGLGFGQNPHVEVCDRPYQHRADQVGVDIASLVVHVRQAEEDILVVWLFWTISGTNVFVVLRPLLDLLKGQKFGPSWRMDVGFLHGARIRGMRASFL
jgi:hypothetical protein